MVEAILKTQQNIGAVGKNIGTNINKTVKNGKEKLEHSKKFLTSMAFLEIFVLVISVANPLMNIPQAISMVETQNISGLNPIGWASSLITSTVWFIYGYKKQLRPLMISNVLWMVMSAALLLEFTIIKLINLGIIRF